MKPYYEHAGITIYHGDCREVLPALGQRFDLLLTDPPYGIKAAKRGAHSSIRDNQKWPECNWDDSCQPESVAASIAIARDAIVWGGNYYSLPPSQCWLVWNKVQRGFSMADGELAWTNLFKSVRIFDLWRSPKTYRDKHHPTGKPLDLMVWSLAQSRDVTSVLDTFMGSGTTLLAAARAGAVAVGIEIEERYCEIAAKRLGQEVLQFGAAS